jgi:hypothetical protein
MPPTLLSLGEDIQRYVASFIHKPRFYITFTQRVCKELKLVFKKDPHHHLLVALHLAHFLRHSDVALSIEEVTLRYVKQYNIGFFEHTGYYLSEFFDSNELDTNAFFFLYEKEGFIGLLSKHLKSLSPYHQILWKAAYPSETSTGQFFFS